MCRCCGGDNPFSIVPLCPDCLQVTQRKMEESDEHLSN